MKGLLHRLLLLGELLFTIAFLVFEKLIGSLSRKLPKLFQRKRTGAEREDPEGDLDADTPALITSKGYPVEEHYATTHDGYILCIHRIPAGRASSSSSSSSPQAQRDGEEEGQDTIKPVVFVLHGFMQSSEAWVCRKKPEDNLALALADLGYDVWLGNVRGNKYSMKHIKYLPQSERYWNFCLDHLLQYDVPAMVEYILAETGAAKLSYIGFSQGSALGFGAFSLNAALAKKINLFIALASTALVKPMANPVINAIAHTRPELLFLMFGRKDFMGSTLAWRMMLSRSAYTQGIERGNNLLFGWTSNRIAAHEKNQVYAHLYATTSVKCIVHWFQIICTRRFQMYDDTLNTSTSDSYYRHSVPAYPLSRISCPVACFYGLRDRLSDMEALEKHLPKQTLYFRESDYEHLDFLWADNLKTKVTPHIVALLDQHNNNPRAMNVSRKERVEDTMRYHEFVEGGDERKKGLNTQREVDEEEEIRVE
ncbi:cholesterol esterase [Balamuthia mandrillaris]